MEYRKPSFSFNTAAFIFGLMVLVAAIAVFNLFNQSLRLDEAQSLWQTSHGPRQILKIVAQDVHVPLYHLLLHFWQKLFGNSVSVVRAFSLLFFIATIPATYFLGKEAYGKKVGLFATTLVAISPFLNWYGSETRMYSMLVFVTVLNQYYFVRIFKRPNQAMFWGYAITALAGIFTHYFFWFSLLAQLIFFATNKELFPKGSGKIFSWISGLLILVFLPWVYFVYKLGFAASTQPMLTQPTTYNLFSTVSEFVFGFQGQDLDRIFISLWPVLVLLAFLALRRRETDPSLAHRKILPENAYFLLSGFLPMMMVFLISYIKPSYLSRYLIFSIPSVYLFISALMYSYAPKIKTFFQYFLIITMLVMLATQIVSASTPVKENYRTAVDYLTQKASSNDVILISAPFTIYPVEYYYHGVAPLQTVPIWNRFSTGSIPAFSEDGLAKQIDADKQQYQTAWVLLSSDQGYNDKIRLYMDTHYQRIDMQNFSSGMSLYAYKLKY